MARNPGVSVVPQRRDYPPDVRARAIARARATTQTQAAAELKVPQQTVSRWLKAASRKGADDVEPDVYTAEKRAELGAKAYRAAEKGIEKLAAWFESLDEERLNKVGRDVAVSVGILMDKYTDLGGKRPPPRFGGQADRGGRSEVLEVAELLRLTDPAGQQPEGG